MSNGVLLHTVKYCINGVGTGISLLGIPMYYSSIVEIDGLYYYCTLERTGHANDKTDLHWYLKKL